MTEVLCGHSFSASAISAVNKWLDEALQAFAERRLSEPFPYLILDARYERVREAGIIISQAVLIAVAVDGEGQRQILGVVSPTERVGRAGATFIQTPWSIAELDAVRSEKLTMTCE